jgi:hypothetical protein
MHGASDLAAASAAQIALPRGKRLALFGRHPWARSAANS